MKDQKIHMTSLILGRVYKTLNVRKAPRAGGYYKILANFDDQYYRAASFTPGSTRRPAERVLRLSSLLSYGLELVDYDDEPDRFRSEEGARRAAEKKLTEKLAEQHKKASDRAAKAKEEKPLGKPAIEKAHDKKGNDNKPRTTGVAFDPETYRQIEAFAAEQQAEADTRGSGELVNFPEAIRRLSRMGLAVWTGRKSAKAAE